VPQAGKQPVSIIIGGLGINASLTEDAITLLPADVTLSFAAQSSGLQGWLNKAREDGHEVMIEIPMESDAFNPSDPSANRTLRTNNISANKRHLDWLLSRAQGYFGVINYNGDKFLTRVNLPYKRGFGIIDPAPNKTLIEIELDRLAASAKAGANPVGIGFAYPETLEALAEWIEGQIWLGKRFGEDGPYAWQCPQGGIDEGEKPSSAAKRELFEETGLRGKTLEKIGKIKPWLYYDFTPEAKNGSPIVILEMAMT